MLFVAIVFDLVSYAAVLRASIIVAMSIATNIFFMFTSLLQSLNQYTSFKIINDIFGVDIMQNLNHKREECATKYKR